MCSKRKLSSKRNKWYSSKEHFDTEKSYEEHLHDIKFKKRKTTLY